MAMRTRAAAYFQYLTSDRAHTWRDLPALFLLSLLAWLYRLILGYTYRRVTKKAAKEDRLPAKVISLGNITVGGTGKTPTACLLARWLKEKGRRVALLNRGYRAVKENEGAIVSDGQQVLLSPEMGGDEACLMARSLPGIPVLIGKDRKKSGRLAIETFDSEILLLDDGFQHWQLPRDLDIVLIDATNPFGNGRVLPRGILREPLSQLARADFFLLTKTDQVEAAALAKIYPVLKKYNPRAKIAESIHRPVACLSFADWEDLQAKAKETSALAAGQTVLAVSALGNPASFEQTLRGYGFRVARTLRYEDHHRYSETEIQTMADLTARTGLPLVTTEKDAVKMPAALIKKYQLPLYVLPITIEITRGREEIESVLEALL